MTNINNFNIKLQQIKNSVANIKIKILLLKIKNIHLQRKSKKSITITKILLEKNCNEKIINLQLKILYGNQFIFDSVLQFKFQCFFEI